MLKKILMCFVLCLSCMALTLGGGMSISATEEEPVIDPVQEEIIATYESGYQISPSSHMEDNNLYSILLKRASEDIKTKHNIDYTFDTIYSDMFKGFTEIVITDNIINSLNGLELIKFDNLKTLKITNNKLVSIEEEIFEYMPVLENVDFSSNLLTSVSFGEIPTLKSVILNNNKLSDLDLIDLGVSSLNLSVAQNEFSSVSAIVFPERISEISLNVINNDISYISDSYFITEKFKLSVGVQGINNDNEISLNTVTPLRYYKTNNPALTLEVYKYNGIVSEHCYTFKDSDIPDGGYYIDKAFPIGEYYFEYHIDGNPAYVKNDPNYAFYKCGEMNIKPTVCDVKYEFKGKEYYTFDEKVTGKVKVILSSIDNGTIMYKVNSGNWQTGNTVMCDQGGNYTIYTKVVIDGVESEEKVILVRTSQNVLIPDFVMLVLILLFTLGLFLIVVPYVSKKFFKK